MHVLIATGQDSRHCNDPREWSWEFPEHCKVWPNPANYNNKYASFWSHQSYIQLCQGSREVPGIELGAPVNAKPSFHPFKLPPKSPIGCYNFNLKSLLEGKIIMLFTYANKISNIRMKENSWMLKSILHLICCNMPLSLWKTSQYLCERRERKANNLWPCYKNNS